MTTDWQAGFAAGIISALTVLYYAEGGCCVRYGEIVQACGAERIIAEARRTGNMRSSGLSTWLRERKGQR